MRVALFLLLLLAVATIPGSLVPQRIADPNGVAEYEANNPELFRVLDAFPIQAFDVYGSVWFSAIYLLLFVSLIGCVLPRIARHWRALRQQPPRTPARLERMPVFYETTVVNERAGADERRELAAAAIEAAARLAARRRYRCRTSADSVSAERGYLRETGNLIFHVALVFLLVSVASGAFTSFNGQRVLTEGETMVNQLGDYDSVKPGRFFDARNLVPFSVKLENLEVSYVKPGDNPAGKESANGLGQVTDYTARMRMTLPNGSESEHDVRVNHPLRAPGSPIYLTANGYSPRIIVRDNTGKTVFDETVPFIAQDQNMTSFGVVKAPYGIRNKNGENTGLGLHGFFYPSKAELSSGAYTSNYPDLLNPVLTLDVFIGDLGLDSGAPQSVYSLDTAKLEQLTGRNKNLKSLELRPGERQNLPERLGSVELAEVKRYVSFDVMANPTQLWTLAFAIIGLAGLMLSLFMPRRRLWIKTVEDTTGIRLQYAGLARGDDPTLETAIKQIRQEHLAALGLTQ